MLLSRARREDAWVWVLGFSLSVPLSAAQMPAPQATTDDRHESQAALERYVVDLRNLLNRNIVPNIRRGILSTASSRPPSLKVEVTDAPSPYAVAARVGSDGGLTVRLSLGYAAMHDAALDAVVLSSVFHRPKALQAYLLYQLRSARDNERRRAERMPIKQVRTFGQFVGLDAKEIQAVYSQPQWQLARERVEIESLGWSIAFLLVQADEKLGGPLPLPSSNHGSAAAHLAAASGWFPVPPFATALHMADIARSSSALWNPRAALCGAANLMEGGIAALHTEARWSAELKENAVRQKQAADIQAQIATMRRDGHCGPGRGVPL